jgi:hypothetical protein
MNSIPSPLDRLLRIERDLEQLKDLQYRLPLPWESFADKPIGRQPWQSDEVLLLRLLRRSPQALLAYHTSAEITLTSERGVMLTAAVNPDCFQLCELNSGDAVVWLQSDPPPWVWTSSTFENVFHKLSSDQNPAELVIQTLPLFKPIVRGKRWSLYRPGEFVPRVLRSPLHDDQTFILRRLEVLERSMSQQLIKSKHEISDLRTQLQVLQDSVDRLSRLYGSGS